MGHEVRWLLGSVSLSGCFLRLWMFLADSRVVNVKMRCAASKVAWQLDRGLTLIQNDFVAGTGCSNRSGRKATRRW